MGVDTVGSDKDGENQIDIDERLKKANEDLEKADENWGNMVFDIIKAEEALRKTVG